jgi:hypothetical protein
MLLVLFFTSISLHCAGYNFGTKSSFFFSTTWSTFLFRNNFGTFRELIVLLALYCCPWGCSWPPLKSQRRAPIQKEQSGKKGQVDKSKWYQQDKEQHKEMDKEKDRY